MNDPDSAVCASCVQGWNSVSFELYTCSRVVCFYGKFRSGYEACCLSTAMECNHRVCLVQSIEVTLNMSRTILDWIMFVGFFKFLSISFVNVCRLRRKQGRYPVIFLSEINSPDCDVQDDTRISSLNESLAYTHSEQLRVGVRVKLCTY